MASEPMKIHDCRLEDEEVVFVKSDTFNRLGPNVTLQNCRINLRDSARWTMIRRCRFIDCEIIAKRKFTNSGDWPHNRLEGCTFWGTFSGNDFGHRDKEDIWNEGGISDCDFSQATLDMCRFWNTDMSTIKLPTWPSFTIMDPAKYSSQVEAIDWPGHGLAGWAYMIAENFGGESAKCDHVPSLLKWAKSDLSESDFKALLDQIDGVVY